MFKIKAADGTNNLTGKKIAQIRKSKKLSQRKLAAQMQLLGFDVSFIRLNIFYRYFLIVSYATSIVVKNCRTCYSKINNTRRMNRNE